MDDLAFLQLIIASISAFVIEHLKKAAWFPWLTEYEDGFNRFVAIAVAVCASIGIAFTYDATAGTLLITGLTWESVQAVGWTSVKQWVLQQLVYKGVVKPDTRRAEDDDSILVRR